MVIFHSFLYVTRGYPTCRFTLRALNRYIKVLVEVTESHLDGDGHPGMGSDGRIAIAYLGVQFQL